MEDSEFEKDLIGKEVFKALDQQTISMCEKIWSLFEVYNLPLVVYKAALLNCLVNVSLELELSVEEMRQIFQDVLIKYAKHINP